MTQLIAYCAVYNEKDFIEFSLKSIYDYVDKIIVIEGAWAENYKVNGHMRSTDGTIRLLRDFPDPDNKITLRFHNEDSQLKQRDCVFDYFPQGDHWLWIVDGDEVYKQEDILKLKNILQNTNAEGIKINSYTFVNDCRHFVPIAFPRVFKIKSGHNYKFCAPNNLLKDGEKIPIVSHEDDIVFYHYSYCHSPERFMEKKKERTKIHGQFSWDMTDGIVHKPGSPPRIFDKDHPIIMKSHPLFNKKIDEEYSQAEIICWVIHSGIGNTLHITPVIKAIRRIKPKAKIYILCWPRSSRILEGLNDADMIIETDPTMFMASLQRRIDYLIISPVGAIVTPQMRAMSNNIMETKIPNGIWTKPEAEYNMDFARKLGYIGSMPDSVVPIFPYNYKNAHDIMKKYNLKISQFIAVNASHLRHDHWSLKNWGMKKYQILINWLNNINGEGEGYPCVLVGAKEDYEDAEVIINEVAAINFECKNFNLCGWSNDIKDTASLLAQARLVIGNDGAISHISTALKVPTITIFTFTNILKNRPLGKNALIAALPCAKRLYCQHAGRYKNCECLDVPFHLVQKKVVEALNISSPH